MLNLMFSRRQQLRTQHGMQPANQQGGPGQMFPNSGPGAANPQQQMFGNMPPSNRNFSFNLMPHSGTNSSFTKFRFLNLDAEIFAH